MRCLCVYIYILWLVSHGYFKSYCAMWLPQLGTVFVGSLYEPKSGAYGDYYDYG